MCGQAIGTVCMRQAGGESMIFSESLKKTKDFSIVYQRGRSWANRTLVLYVLRRKGSERNRVGISVSKKVGNSVVRHHLTRLVRESYRLHETEFVKGLDLIVLVRPGAKESDFFTVERALLSLARRAEITEYNAEKGGGHEEIHDVVHP
jgi:ribonuclease P protein component